MKVSEIVIQDAGRKGQDGEGIVKAMAKLLEDKRAIVFKQNESVLFLVDLGDKTYETHLFSLDTPLKLSQAMLKFFELIKKMPGMNTIYGKADGPQILSLLKSLAKREEVEIEESDKPDYNWMLHI